VLFRRQPSNNLSHDQETQFRLFTERGWDRTRLADVAAEAGVSAATLYNHFPSKYVLIGRVFAHVYAPLERRAERLRHAAPSVSEAVAVHVRALAALTREYRALTAAFACGVQEYTARHGGPPVPGDDADPRVLAPVPHLLVEMIREGQQSGELRGFPNATDLGEHVTYLLFLRCFMRPLETAGESADAILTMLFGALRPELLERPGVQSMGRHAASGVRKTPAARPAAGSQMARRGRIPPADAPLPGQDRRCVERLERAAALADRPCRRQPRLTGVPLSAAERANRMMAPPLTVPAGAGP
jgi:AcrR family transcriptional regulator